MSERDSNQRSMGYLGLSALLHVGVLTVILLAPSFKSLNSIEGANVEMKGDGGEITSAASGGGPSHTESTNELTGLPTENSAGNGAVSTTSATSTSSEVLLADANDTSGVPVSRESLETTKTASPENEVTQPSTSSELKSVNKPAEPAQIETQRKQAVATQTAVPTKTQRATTQKTVVKPTTAKTETPNGEVEIAAALNEARKPAPRDEAKSNPEISVATDDSVEEHTLEAKQSTQPPISSLAESETNTETTVAVAELPAQEVAEQNNPAKPTTTTTATTTSATEAPTEESADERETPATTPTRRSSIGTGLTSGLEGSSSVGTGTTGGSTAASSSGPSTSAGTGTTRGPGTTDAAQPGAGTSETTQGGSPTATGAAPSSGDQAQGIGSAAGAQAVRDARSLEALPGNPRPTYPMQDRVAGRQGTTVLIGRVKPDGTMAEVTVEKSSGSKLMDEAAARAFKGWRYKPGQAGLVRYPVQFQLVGDAAILPTQLRRQ